MLIKKHLNFCVAFFNLLKMQAAKSNSNPLGANLHPMKDSTGVAVIDYNAEIDGGIRYYVFQLHSERKQINRQPLQLQ